MNQIEAIKAGIFDIGGVLITNENQYVQQDIINTLGLTQEVFKSAWDDLTPLLGKGIITEEEYWTRFIDQTKSPNKLPKESLLVREYAKRCSPIQEVLTLVKSLKKDGLRLALLSNTIEPHVSFLRQMELFDDFNVRVFSNEVGMQKPNPRIYQCTLEQLETTPNQTFLVDDLVVNVEAAIRLGIHGILYQSPDQLKTELEGLELKV